MKLEGAPRQRGLVIVNKAERLLLDLAPHIDRIPKHQRYRFAIRLEDALWELIQCLISAAVSGQKSKLYRADEQVRYVHALLRHAAENRSGGRPLLRGKRVGDASRQLSEIGAMLGAWRKRIAK